MKPIKLVIAEDSHLLRKTMVDILSTREQIILTAQVANGKALISAVEKDLPDVILTDIRMPLMGGIEATGLIHRRFPDLPILTYSSYDDMSTICESFFAGAKGFVSKLADTLIIAEAVEAAAQGFSFYDYKEDGTVMSLVTGRDIYEDLGESEINIFEAGFLHLLWKYKGNIAAVLELNPDLPDIGAIQKGLFKRFEVNTTRDLLLFSLHRGIIQPSLEIA